MNKFEVGDRVRIVTKSELLECVKDNNSSGIIKEVYEEGNYDYKVLFDEHIGKHKGLYVYEYELE